MKKALLVAVFASLLSACQVGSETALRQDLVKKEVNTGESTLEMAPRGWYNGAEDDPLMTWDEANRVLKDLKIDGKKGWRLPTGEELLVLCSRSEQPLCFPSDFEIPETNYAMNDPDLPLEMIRYGRNAEQKKHWWWLSTAMGDEVNAVVMAPNYVRTFARKTERFVVRPVRGVAGKDDHPPIEWSSDLDEVNSGGCYTESREPANIAWMKSCSQRLLCGEMQVRGCVLGMTSVAKDNDRTVVVVIADTTLDTYEYVSPGSWELVKRQPLPGLLEPDRIDAMVVDISFVDFTSDGLSDLAIRIGNSDFGTAASSLGLGLFTWDSVTQLWERVEVPFADGQNYRENGLLRWGHLDGMRLYEEVGYLPEGGHVEDQSYEFIWENGKFRYLGVVDDVAAFACMTCPAEAADPSWYGY